MENEIFKIYLISGDKDSLKLLKYYIDNLDTIISYGFPRPSFVKYNRRELKKYSQNLLTSNIKMLPCVVFNGQPYYNDEIYELLKVNIRELSRQKNEKEQQRRKALEENEEEYYDNLEDYYSTIVMKDDGKNDDSDSDEDKPLTKKSLDKMMSKKKEEDKRHVTFADSEVNDNKNDTDKKNKKKKKKSKKDSSSEDDISIDTYYENLANSNYNFDGDD